MITVGMNYKVIPGKDEQFLAVFRKVREIVEQMEGHGWTKLYRDVDSPHDYLLISEWTSEEAFRAFIASDRFRNVTNWGKENILAERPTHEVYGESRPVG
jgi:heme-degrading monooxygenase HmoA